MPISAAASSTASRISQRERGSSMRHCPPAPCIALGPA